MSFNLKLVIGNKNYSSWSMRPWVLLRQAGIEFEEVQLKFADDNRVIGVERWSPNRQVPVLFVNGERVWDSLAISEAVAELFPRKNLWPENSQARALARSVCAEMHSGFRSLRAAMPMNIRASHPGKGMNDEVRRDIDRIVALWDECRERFGSPGDLLFGHFTIADAYYAPVAMRFVTYGPSLPSSAQRYVDVVRSLPAVVAWISAALSETEFVAADEPYAVKK
ncbi:MAG TPA: glutathione S-transferase [Burkholderiales bacterium]|nr:glutathione S-transferase [Burkholderiales bacterium]